MSDFVARMVTRTTGATGIQPRIAPITAPDPWHEPADLELAMLETEVSLESPAPAYPSPTPDASRWRRAPLPAVELDSRSRARVELSADVSVAEPVVERGVEREEIFSPVTARPRDLRADESKLAMREVPDGPARSSTRAEQGFPDRVAPESSATSRERFDERDDAPEAATSGSRRAGLVPSFRVRVPGLVREHVPARDHSEGPSILEVHGEIEGSSSGPDSRSTAASEHARSPSGARARAHAAAAAIDPPPDLPRPPRRREAASEGVVRVEIGRVELRAAPSREPARSERGVPKPDTFVSLKQYMRERGGT